MLPVTMGGIGLVNPSQVAALKYATSANICGPLTQQIESQAHELLMKMKYTLSGACQEPTWSLQLYCVRATAFSQVRLFLD